jgi:hypothetical protein
MHFGKINHLQLKVISWLLVAAVFALTVQPMHIHLQHVGDASSLIHEHAIDLHLAVDNIAPANQEEGAVFEVTPDVMSKKPGDNTLLAGIMVCLSFLLFLVAFSFGPRPTVRIIRPIPGWFTIAPPLRAPPHNL